MRVNESYVKRMWPVMFLGAALLSGCGGTDAAPVEPSRAGSMRTVGSGVDEGGLPNLVLASLESPAVVPQGSEFSIRVKVCNPGAAPAEGRVHFYLSQTPEPSPGSGINLGETNVGALNPGQCITRDQPANSWQPDGGHYLVAIADADGSLAESSEDDNTRAHRLWIGQAAELVVTAIETPSFVRPGEAIPFRMTLCNQGTLPANASAGLYLSTDAHFSPEDTFLSQTFPSWLEGGELHHRE